MLKIRIIAVPPGQAPEDVRKQWVGVEIPLLPNQDFRKGFVTRGVLEGKPDRQNMDGYHVNTDAAICALKAKNTKDAEMAVKWWDDWRKSPLGRTCYALVFAKEVCELV
ncbi:MAG: hypothetical protein NTY93_03365 [Candidatus Kaiserbacteria bacterium]|nr:hypothetical protein [Candidatus Kaiserbacteria bacterium]